MKNHNNIIHSKINSNLKFDIPANLGAPGQKLMNFLTSNWGRSVKDATELTEDFFSVDNPGGTMLTYFVGITNNLNNPEGIKYFEELVGEIMEGNY